jgi:hypothetical protein
VKVRDGQSVIGGNVTVVTDCNCGSKSLVDLLGGTGWREKYLVEKVIIEFEILGGAKLTWLY